MKKIALLFSHKLTPAQNEDIKTSLGAKKIYNLPLELQSIWSQVPTDKDLIFNDYLEDIKKFLNG